MAKKIAEITEPDFKTVPDAPIRQTIGYTFHETDPASNALYLGFNPSEELRFHLPYRLTDKDQVSLSVPRHDATNAKDPVNGKMALVEQNKADLQLVDDTGAVLKTSAELAELFAQRIRIMVTPPAAQKSRPTRPYRYNAKEN